MRSALAITVIAIYFFLLDFAVAERTQPPVQKEEIAVAELLALSDEMLLIVGGREADPGSKPWQVALVYTAVPENKDAQFCGGTLLTSRWVLTAAHCLFRNRFVFSPDSIEVLVGTQDLEAGGERIKVAAVFPHRSYVPEEFSGSYDHDIALVRLADEPGVNATWKQIIAATPAIEAAHAIPEVSLNTTGWGRTVPDDANSTSTKLLEVDVKLKSKVDCEAAYLTPEGDTKITRNMFCAGVAAGGKDSCQGDSGGPITIAVGASDPRQLGIVSWGEGCAKPGKFGVYTRIPNYSEWIGGIKARPVAANDEFENATEFTGIRGSISGYSQYASMQTGEPDAGYGVASVWWRWTAPRDAVLKLDTTGSNIEAYMSVYTGDSLANLSWVESGYSDGYDGTHAEVEFRTNAGETYHIVVYAWRQSGDITLNYRMYEFVSGGATDNVNIAVGKLSNGETVMQQHGHGLAAVHQPSHAITDYQTNCRTVFIYNRPKSGELICDFVDAIGYGFVISGEIDGNHVKAELIGGSGPWVPMRGTGLIDFDDIGSKNRSFSFEFIYDAPPQAPPALIP